MKSMVARCSTAIVAGFSCLLVYVLCYMLLVEKVEYWIQSVGPAGPVVFPRYRLFDLQTRDLFEPLYWVDSQIVRPDYWTPVKETFEEHCARMEKKARGTP